MKIFERYKCLILLFSLSIFTMLCVVSCARMGSPDGGWYDETPPRVVGATPADKAVGVKNKKIKINFSEFIKIENASEKVVISPPQMEQAEIKAHSKTIIVDLQDSLKSDVTYTIDFSDAIVDNNESNPMGNYTYSFSTGDVIDTLEVSGMVINAEDLEPIKGILVGLYRVEGDSLWLDSLVTGKAKFDESADTIFRKQPMLRVSRTNSEGKFIIRGVAPGYYRCVALQDMDNDYCYSQNAEKLAFSTDVFVPSCRPDFRQDTIWSDELHIKDIARVKYTHFFPDNILLRAFLIDKQDRFLLKTERKTPDVVSVFFSGPGTMLPTVQLLNAPEGLPHADDPFIVEATEKFDTITYWLRDTALVDQDTLHIIYNYEATDTLGNLVMMADTTEWLSKMPYKKRMKELAKEREEWEKKLEKRRKKGEEPTDTIMPEPFFEPKYRVPQSMLPDGHITIDFPAPLEKFDSAAIHLYAMRDSVWYRVPFDIAKPERNTITDRCVNIIAEWLPETEYSFEIDTLAFESIYGLKSKQYKSGFKVASLNDFSSLFVDVSGYTLPADTTDSLGNKPQVIVYLLDSGGKVLKESVVNNGTAEFYYVSPNTYYLKALIDRNGNGKWDAGDYDLHMQPEEVYYNSQEVECKAKWDVTRAWNLSEKPFNMQKPEKLIKQKADKAKTIKQRNAERARQKGIEPPK